MTQPLYSRRDLIDAAGADEQALKFWLREGLLLPAEAASGRGKHLRFPISEMAIAAILDRGRSVGLNIDALRAVASVVRDAFGIIASCSLAKADWNDLQDELSSSRRFSPEQRHDLEQYWIDKGDFSTHKIVKAGFDEEAQRVPRPNIKDAADIILERDDTPSKIVSYLLIREGMLLHFRGEGNSWVTEAKSSIEGKMPSDVCVILDLDLILANLPWPDADGEDAS